MKKRRPHWDTLVFGNAGSDLYMLAADRCVSRGGGAALNLAHGICAAGGSATIVASASRGFNRPQPTAWKDSMTVHHQVAHGAADHVRLFDFRTAGAESVATFDADPHFLFDEHVLHDILSSGFIAHVASMPAERSAHIVAAIQRTGKAALLSSSAAMGHAGPFDESLRSALSACDILFFDESAFTAALKAYGRDAVCAGRVVVIATADGGASLFVDSVPVVHCPGHAADEACSLPAREMFVGAFLAAFSTTRNATAALASAVRIAAGFTLEGGCERVAAAASFSEASLHVDAFGEVGISELTGEGLRVSRVGPNETLVEATGVFVVRSGKLLLARKAPGRELVPGVFYVPGGKLEAGETPEGCARRELKEETGLDALGLRYVGTSAYRDADRCRVYKFHQYLVTSTAGEPHAADDLQSLSWISVDDLTSVKQFPLTRAQVQLLLTCDLV